jgi:hypothetical protein
LNSLTRPAHHTTTPARARTRGSVHAAAVAPAASAHPAAAYKARKRRSYNALLASYIRELAAPR